MAAQKIWMIAEVSAYWAIHEYIHLGKEDSDIVVLAMNNQAAFHFLSWIWAAKLSIGVSVGNIHGHVNLNNDLLHGLLSAKSSLE